MKQNGGDPHLPLPMLQRIRAPGPVTSVVSATPQNGGADDLFGDAGTTRSSAAARPAT